MVRKELPANQKIVFFDGLCGLCNRTIDMLMKSDKKDSLHFAPLQGKTAASLLPQDKIASLDSIVYWDGKDLHDRSTAVLLAIKEIGGIWRVPQLLRHFPKPLRDKAYGMVANRRYALFGSRDTCRIPTDKERGKMLP